MKQIFNLLFILLAQVAFSQIEVNGLVTDPTGSPIAGANIIEKGTSNGTTTDFDGKYSITVPSNATIEISYIGFETQEIQVNESSTINVTLTEGVALDDIVIVGSRAAPRSNTTTSLPVDILASKDLVNTGQITFDKALQYKIPSFNTVQTPVNDATSLLDPYEIRNMGPSRTLILINGKRKNLSALLYTQTSPGRGETGADISAIPVDAIERVEILRDGASAQYGSDAIAGVVNIVLKEGAQNGSATLRTGISAEGDGEMIGISTNNGTLLGAKKGFINYTIDFSKVSMTNRPGTVDAAGEFADFGGTTAGVNTLADIQNFLNLYPDAGNRNASPETAAAKFLVNGSYDISDRITFYANAAYVYKKVNSFANYRTPYWRTVTDFPYLQSFFPNGPNGQYVGYLPTFDGDLNDYNATAGLKLKNNGWTTDLSFTAGGNSQVYTVLNSHNRSSLQDNNGNNIYQENSPISFKPGGTRFTHQVGNIDLSKALTESFSLGFGAEFRSETFDIIEGGLASYDGIGADSFAGNRPENSGSFNRYNFGGYIDASWDVTEDFLLNGTIRLEDYSDFGNAFVWKASSRYKFLEDKLTLRASVSTGFRAPTLHQIYTQKSQYSFVPGSGIQVSGLVNNVSPQAKQLGIPQLDAEKSTNFTAGIGAKITNKLSLTLDYYNIKVSDRIVLSNELNTAFGTISYFSNAFDTRTSGLDAVVSYKKLPLGQGHLNLNLSGNITIDNERISDVPVLGATAIIDPTQEALLFTSRPNTKWILGTNYNIKKFDFSLNNTYFGKTTFKQAGMSTDLRTEFIPKIVTDLGINYNATEKITINVNINNLFNILPEWEFKAENQAGTALLNDPAQVQQQSNLITFNQRYSQMTYDGYHFSQLGTMFNLAVNYKL